MVTAASTVPTLASCSTLGAPALTDQLTHNHSTRPSPRFAGLCFIRARAMSIARQRSSNRVHLYTLVHTLRETTATNGTPLAMLTIDRSTARHFLAKARLLPLDCQGGRRGFESLHPLSSLKPKVCAFGFCAFWGLMHSSRRPISTPPRRPNRQSANQRCPCAASASTNASRHRSRVGLAYSNG